MLAFTGRWCCSNCCKNNGDDTFCLADFFPSPIYIGETGIKLKAKRKREQANRRVIDRKPLMRLFYEWRKEAHNTDPLRGVRPVEFILDNKAIDTIGKILPSKVTSGTITERLAETREWELEWGEKLVAVITKYDLSLAPIVKRAPVKRRKVVEVPRIALKDKIILIQDTE